MFSTTIASSRPGQAGMVLSRISSGTSPVLRNWKWVPMGILILVSGISDVKVSASSSFRHISPSPAMTYHTSTTERCFTACVVAPGGRVQWARAPHGNCRSVLISEPSGAIWLRSIALFFAYNMFIYFLIQSVRIVLKVVSLHDWGRRASFFDAAK